MKRLLRILFSTLILIAVAQLLAPVAMWIWVAGIALTVGAVVMGAVALVFARRE